jgi:hypothetical protein
MQPNYVALLMTALVINTERIKFTSFLCRLQFLREAAIFIRILATEIILPHPRVTSLGCVINIERNAYDHSLPCFFLCVVEKWDAFLLGKLTQLYSEA